MSKGAAVLVAVVVGGLAYLAFDPRAAADLQNWANRQLGRARSGVPDGKPMGTPGYMPVVPGKGL
jgi:hypothetical protein